METGLFAQIYQRKTCFFGNPAMLKEHCCSLSIRGFVPPGYPGFTFSETYTTYLSKIIQLRYYFKANYMPGLSKNNLLKNKEIMMITVLICSSRRIFCRKMDNFRQMCKFATGI